MSGPIFIVGTMRSGSTLLRLILDSHPNVAIGPESGFMGAASAMKAIPAWDAGPGWYDRFGLDEAQMDARIRRFFCDIFERYATERGKVRWGDKTPFHTWHVEQMARIFPDAVFIGIVRHPSAAGVSMRRWRYSFADGISKWVRANAEIVRQARRLGPQRFAVCRYEDLVLAPEPTLRALLDFLGEPWSDRLLAHDQVQRDQQTPAVADGGARPGDPIDAARVAQWVHEITPEERAMVAARVPSALLDLFGYRTDHAEPLPLAERSAGGAPGLVPVEHADVDALPRGKYAVGAFDPDRTALPADPAELAHRLQKAERRLERLAARPDVRVARTLKALRRSRPLRVLRQGLWTGRNRSAPPQPPAAQGGRAR
ncbi:MAG: sulfotransferase family protein [Egibacteraceae bacterium]